jgi:hypothetical protein
MFRRKMAVRRASAQKMRRTRGLNKQGMNDVIYRAKRSFGFAILGRGIWTRKIKKYAM